MSLAGTYFAASKRQAYTQRVLMDNFVFLCPAKHVHGAGCALPHIGEYAVYVARRSQCQSLLHLLLTLERAQPLMLLQMATVAHSSMCPAHLTITRCNQTLPQEPGVFI
eukprot:GHRQ01032510.1.p1 GENE.GHRQ01032510.1~~GHRQ01032510.1.p1  ORF type:complete len:109 (+),score=3.19 GHRQ01032510.1:116-442(+)